MSDMTTIEAVLDFAIGEEEKAVAMYNDLALRTDNASIREVFVEMAKQEQGHKARLEAIKKGGKLVPGPGKVQDLGIAELIAPVELKEGLSFEEILAFAMQREKAAREMYETLANVAPTPDLANAFRALANEEGKHKLHIETFYDEYMYPEN